MSVRWMYVQYVGSTLRLPIVSEGDFDKPIGSSRLERVVEKIEVRDVDGEEKAFVPESLLNEKDAENARLRELVLCLLTCLSDSGDACDKCPVNGGSGIWDFADFCDSLLDRVRELRIEVDA